MPFIFENDSALCNFSPIFWLVFMLKKLKIIELCRILPKKLWIYAVFGIYANRLFKNEYIQFVQNRETIFLSQKSYLFYMFSCILSNFFEQLVVINKILRQNIVSFVQYI
jgi:hypothetical protein